ncbi:MAG: antitoxin VbhA family protein [Microbacteriaceae bacterium]|uniref:antitoxin VbhA family protein n=1 Tax=Microbacterium sp. TaxID=51671 RepID=UPI003F9D03C1
MPDQSFVEHEVANIVASWAMEGQHGTAEEVALLHDVAAGRISGEIMDIIRRLDTD